MVLPCQDIFRELNTKNNRITKAVAQTMVMKVFIDNEYCNFWRLLIFYIYDKLSKMVENTI